MAGAPEGNQNAKYGSIVRGAIRRALVGSQQPSLCQRGNAVHRRQQASILPTGQSGTLAAPFVYIAQLVQSAVATPTIGDDPGARLDMVRHEGVQ